MKSHKKHSYYLLLAIFVAGCASQPVLPPQEDSVSVNEESTAVDAPAVATADVEIEYGNFTEDELYQAIISELSAQRGEVADAGETYFDLALQTRDLGIIQRAMQFASVNNDVNAILQLGLLWTEVDPEAAQPHLMLSFQFLEAGNFQQALSHMARVIELGGEMDFSALAARTGQLDASTRTLLIENLRQLVREFSDQQSIRMTLVQLLAQNAQYTKALTELDQLLEPCRGIPGVIDVRSKGAVGVVQVDRLHNLERLREQIVKEGIWLRPFGDMIYMTPPLSISCDQLRTLSEATVRAIEEWATWPI